MAFPKKIAIFTASFDNVGQSDEVLKINWNWPNPPANPGNRSYLVGSECFLESATAISSIPDEHLLASISMMAILANVLPGTQEFIDAVTNQESANFQTIVGNVKLKTSTPSEPNPMPVIDPTYGPTGTVFDLNFQRVGTSPVKTVRADVWNLSQYVNRQDLGSASVDCVPGAIHKAFGFKKSDLGAANSANRQAVIDFVASRLFWV